MAGDASHDMGSSTGLPLKSIMRFDVTILFPLPLVGRAGVGVG
jgi:hypothetical protein